MDTEMQKRLDRIDASLNKLIHAISTGAAPQEATSDLIAADRQLSSSLTKLAEHQRNHDTIQQLRQTSIALDRQLTSSLEQFAELRTALIAAKIDTRPNTSRVSASELLRYAARIAKFTRPPPSADVLARPPKADAPTSPPNVEQEPQTPFSGSAGSPNVPRDPNLDLPASEAEWIQTQPMGTFVPWPSEDIIRQGHLYLSQNNLSQAPDLPALEPPPPPPKLEPEVKMEPSPRPAAGSAELPARPESARAPPLPPPAPPADVPKKETQYAGLDDFDMDDD